MYNFRISTMLQKKNFTQYSSIYNTKNNMNGGEKNCNKNDINININDINNNDEDNIDDDIDNDVDKDNDVDNDVDNNNNNNNGLHPLQNNKRKLSMTSNETNISDESNHPLKKKRKIASNESRVDKKTEGNNKNDYMDLVAASFDLEEFEVKVSNNNRDYWRCAYHFNSGCVLEIDKSLGRFNSEVKDALDIIKQDLTNQRAKATLQTDKNTYLVWVRKPNNEMISSAIIHVDRMRKRVNIEMFAVDRKHRGLGFADIMIRAIQYRMQYFSNFDLFVCATLKAEAFWTNPKYHFERVNSRLLDEHEIYDEKNGNVTHLIWFGNHDNTKNEFIKCFLRYLV